MSETVTVTVTDTHDDPMSGSDDNEEPSVPPENNPDKSDSKTDELKPKKKTRASAASASQRKGMKAAHARIAEKIKQHRTKHKKPISPTALHIPKEAMYNLIKETILKMGEPYSGFRWKSEAKQAIHMMSEYYLVDQFDKANLLASHANRKTISVDDLAMVGLLKDRRVSG